MISPRVSVQIAKAVATAVVTRSDATHLPTAAALRREFAPGPFQETC
jgi:hypothetical protein